MLTFLRIRSPVSSGTGRQDFNQNEIHIGRPDPESSYSPDYNLEPDLRVSRRHARIFKGDKVWMIEDLDSKHGTFVDEQKIGSEPTPLPPGTVVKTGETKWTTIPGEWLLVKRGDVIIFCPCTTQINYALYHCGTPVIGVVTAINTGERVNEPFMLRLQIVEFSDSCKIEIPGLEPHVPELLGVPSVRLYSEKLNKQDTQRKGRIYVEVDGRRYPDAEKDVTILGFRDMLYDPIGIVTIAAFVSPRDSVTERIVLCAQDMLTETTGVKSFDSLLKSGREDAELLILEALYAYMKDECSIQYRGPLLQDGPGCEKPYQTINPPHRIIGSDNRGVGNCIDLTLLMAGCLENIGLFPLVIFIGKEEGVPLHAFIGLWTGSTPGGRPVLNDRDNIIDEINCGNILVAECTGFAEGAFSNGSKLDFDDAVKYALNYLSDPWVCAVDIGVLRPPYGTVTPIDSPLEPEVIHAYDEAEKFARRMKNEALGTIHLLYGVLAAGGEVVTSVFNEAGVNINDLRSCLEQMIPIQSAVGVPSQTRNCFECKRLAEEVAWRSGSSVVQEQDFLWALFVKGEYSAAFRSICIRAGVGITEILNILIKRFPQFRKKDFPDSI